MIGASDTRFKKGQSGNPSGRPRQRRPHVSAFDIIFDKTLTVTQNGAARELSVDEALQFQTYQAALKGSKMAIRQVLKMIEKREIALSKRNKAANNTPKLEFEYDADNATQAMRILGIADDDPAWGSENPRIKVAAWATQAALSRPGRRKFSNTQRKDIKFFTMDADKLTWPRGSLP